MTNPFLPQQSASVTPGQPSVCRVDGETFVGDSDPTPDATRRLSVDATGQYIQHLDATDVNPPLSLQVNQAGWALVGWIARAPDFVQPQAALPADSVASAVLVANLDPKSKVAPPNGAGALPSAEISTGSAVHYKDVDRIEGHDPNEVLDPEDPFSIDQAMANPADSDVGNGWIAFDVIGQPGVDGWDEIVPRLRATIVLIRKSGTVQTLVFDMRNPFARVSERTLGAQEPTLQGYLAAHHQHPIPPSFLDDTQPSGALWKAAIAMFAQDGALETHIREYVKVATQPAATRAVPRDAIAGVVRAAIGSWQDGSALADLLNCKLVMKADRPITVNDVDAQGWVLQFIQASGGLTLTIVQWLSAIGGAEMSDLPKSATDVAPGAVPSLSAVPKEFTWLCGDVGMYHYDFTFSSLSPAEMLDLKKRLPQLPDRVLKHIPVVPDASKSVGTGGAVCMGAFKATISASSALALKGGAPPPDDQFSPLWKDKVFYGVFCEAGISLGALPKLPSQLRISAPWKLQADAFVNAIFELKAAQAQVVGSVPFWKSFSVGGALSVMTFHVGNGMVIEGDFGEGSILPQAVPDSDPVPDPLKVKDLVKARGKGAGKTIFDTVTDGSGLGAGFAMGALMIGRPDVEHWVVPPKERTAVGGDGRTVAPLFKVDSADINSDLNGWSRRFLLESVLAVDLYLFNGAPSFSVIGHASPEGTPRHNLVLSRLRAAVVRQAIIDTGVVSGDLVDSDGDGDELALRTPVNQGDDPTDSKTKMFDEPDPDGDTTKRDAFAKAHTEQADRWPEFRKVVVEWWGRFFLTVLTVHDGDQQVAPSSQPQPGQGQPPQQVPPDPSPGQQAPPASPSPSPDIA